jgi:hypothetical protein
VTGSFSYVAGVELGKQIAAVLGIDPTQIIKMTIEMNAEGPVYVIVEAFMPDDHGALVEQMSRYRLVDDPT